MLLYRTITTIVRTWLGLFLKLKSTAIAVINTSRMTVVTIATTIILTIRLTSVTLPTCFHT